MTHFSLAAQFHKSRITILRLENKFYIWQLVKQMKSESSDANYLNFYLKTTNTVYVKYLQSTNTCSELTTKNLKQASKSRGNKLKELRNYNREFIFVSATKKARMC